MAIEFPKLPFAEDALEPYMSATTLAFHYGKHHKAYVDNLNKLIAGSQLDNLSLEEIIKETAGLPDKQAIFNNAAQAWNHNFFWQCIAPEGGQAPKGALLKKIEAAFGSYDEFCEAFLNAAVTQFGSGWAWLVEDNEGKLSIMKTSNADTPLAHGLKPLMTVDVWEHAYYLDYQNARADFVRNFITYLMKF